MLANVKTQNCGGDETIAVKFDAVTCEFPARDEKTEGYIAVKDVTLDVANGEFLSIVGPTGCGKSTLLNVAAGLLEPSYGSIQIFGESLRGLNTSAGYLFQSDTLMPWRTALENVTTGLEIRGRSREGTSGARATMARTSRS